MCNPALVAAGGMAVSALGTIAQGQAASGQAAYQAQVARNNQIIADRNAADALKRGDVEEDKLRQRNAALIGRQRAELAGQGTLIDDGSSLDQLVDSAGLGEFDALTLRGGYEREAYSHRTAAMNQESRARLADSQTGTLGSWLAAGGSVLGAAYKAYSNLNFGGGSGSGVSDGLKPSGG